MGLVMKVTGSKTNSMGKGRNSGQTAVVTKEIMSTDEKRGMESSHGQMDHIMMVSLMTT